MIVTKDNYIEAREITTESHTITARYEFEGQIEGHILDVNGPNLDEIIQDLKVFLNGMDEAATKFNIWDAEGDEEELEVILRGKTFKEDGEGGYTTDTNVMRVTITAVAK